MTPSVLPVHSFTGETDISFNITDYSRLKSGDDKITNFFGKEMAQNFIGQILSSPPNIVCTISQSHYRLICPDRYSQIRGSNL